MKKSDFIKKLSDTYLTCKQQGRIFEKVCLCDSENEVKLVNSMKKKLVRLDI